MCLTISKTTNNHNSITISSANTIELEQSKTSYNDFNLNYYIKKYNNQDILGKITIKNTNIDTLFAQTTNNNYYLSHSLDKTSNELGSLFLDYRVNIDDKKIIIYGHNSLYYDTPFKELENYLNYDYYLSHNHIKISTLNNYYLYEIFSVFLTTNDYEYFKIYIPDYELHLLYLKNISIYNTNVNISNEDILILQTCSNYYNNTYLIVVAKKIEKGEQ